MEGWFVPGATVRVATQGIAVFEGTVELIAERGVYFSMTRQLYMEGYGDIKPPVKRFVPWSLLQFADLMENDEARTNSAA